MAHIPGVELGRRAILASAGAVLAAAGTASAATPASNRGAKHNIVILISSDDEKIMAHAISYTMNLARSYAANQETVAIEVVANGSGIKIFRADISPLREPLALVQRAMPDIVFSMCDSSRQIAEQREGRAIALVPGAGLVPFGIRRLVELQEAGWSYIHG